MEGLLKDGFSINYFIFGFEVVDVMGSSAAVGTATSVAEFEVMIHDIVCHSTPIRRC